MGLDDLLDNSTTQDKEQTVNTPDVDISTEDVETGTVSNTEPATDTLPRTKECPNCGEEATLWDDVWRCEEKWCGVDHFLTEEGHFALPLTEDEGFLSGYSV